MCASFQENLARPQMLLLWLFVQGVMAARGILTNPAMYAEYSHTPIECVSDWVSAQFTLQCDCDLPS